MDRARHHLERPAYKAQPRPSRVRRILVAVGKVDRHVRQVAPCQVMRAILPVEQVLQPGVFKPVARQSGGDKGRADVAAGRFVPLTPQRLFDTRPGSHVQPHFPTICRVSLAFQKAPHRDS